MILRLAFAVLLTATLLRADPPVDRQSQTIPLASGGEIRLGDVNGSITIRGWDRPEVLLQYEKQASSEEYLREIQVEIGGNAQLLTIDTIFPHHPFRWSWWNHGSGSVRYTLNVPKSAVLGRISLVNGPISVDGVEGVVRASDVNGGIRAAGLRGPTTLTTVNGSIRAEFGALEPGSRLRFSSVNGSISAVLPKATGAGVRLSTVNGRVASDLDLQIAEVSQRRLSGTIGDGNGSIDASTVNGSVRLVSAQSAQ